MSSANRAAGSPRIGLIDLDTGKSYDEIKHQGC
jgi:hypothetical protein